MQLALDFGPHQHALDAIAANDATQDGAYRVRDRDRFYSSKAWRRARGHVLAKWGARCCKCGATARDRRIDVDHIVPRSRAPELELWIPNLQVLCESCHEAKTYRDGLRLVCPGRGARDVA